MEHKMCSLIYLQTASEIFLILRRIQRGIIINLLWYSRKVGNRGGTVFKGMCYKSEGRWFDSRWCHWNFSLT